jgi:hypothetical protein
MLRVRASTIQAMREPGTASRCVIGSSQAVAMAR